MFEALAEIQQPFPDSHDEHCRTAGKQCRIRQEKPFSDHSESQFRAASGVQSSS
jgi:hypothetical protein